jgi:hypothetical protein
MAPDSEGSYKNHGHHPLQTKRKRLLTEMVDTTFLIQFRTPNLGPKFVVADRAEVRGEHLLLLHSDGQLVTTFLLDNVKSWSEVSPEVV